jgi:hypothetical protein
MDNDYQIIFDQHSVHLTDFNAWTLLTRGKRNVYCIWQVPKTLQERLSPILRGLAFAFEHKEHTNRWKPFTDACRAHVQRCIPLHLRSIPTEQKPEPQHRFNVNALDATEETFQEELKRHASRGQPPQPPADEGKGYVMAPSLNIEDVRAAGLLRGGSDIEPWQEKLDALPHLAGSIDSSPEPKHPEPNHPREPSLFRDSGESLTTYLHRENPTFLHAELLDNLASPEDRELYHAGIKEATTQISDDLVQSIFLAHRSKDQATTKFTEEKRVKRSTRAANEISWTTSKLGGDLLFAAFLQGFPLPKAEFDEDLFEDCRRENDSKYLERDLPTLLKRADRSDPDWRINTVELFLKNQVIKKIEKIGSDAKPGQLIASFRTELLQFWGPYARYITKKVQAGCPPNVYLHLGKSPDDLEDFLKEHWVDGRVNTDGDYTAFDASQDAAFGHFELRLMEHLGIPTEIREAYKLMKSTLESKFGTLAVMRFTGEVFTFIFNTLGNMAYSNLKYIIPKGVAQLWGGDDKSINCRLHVRPGWHIIAGRYLLEEKQTFSEHSTFCGWIVSSRGLLKDPRLLYWRTRVMARRYSPLEWAPSYYLELVISLEKGEFLHDLLDEAGRAHLSLLLVLYRAYALAYPTVAAVAAAHPLPTHIHTGQSLSKMHGEHVRLSSKQRNRITHNLLHGPSKYSVENIKNSLFSF